MIGRATNRAFEQIADPLLQDPIGGQTDRIFDPFCLQIFVPKFNQNVDMYFDTPDGIVLAEMKSCTENNFHSQLRKGISQLFEYRFLYKDVVRAQPKMLLLMETVPPKSKKWLADYVASLGIVLAWKEPHRQTIVSTCSVPSARRSKVRQRIHLGLLPTILGRAAQRAPYAPA